MGEEDRKERLPGSVLPACSAPSSGGFQCDSRNEKAQRGPPREEEDLLAIVSDDMQAPPVHLLWILHILNYTQHTFNLAV